MRIECIIDGVDYSAAVTAIAEAYKIGLSEAETKIRLSHLPLPGFRFAEDGITICYPVRQKSVSSFEKEICILAHAHPHSKCYAAAIKSVMEFSKIHKARRFITGRWTHYMRTRTPWIKILTERGKSIDPRGIVSDSDRWR